jgi:hypothetical protein
MLRLWDEAEFRKLVASVEGLRGADDLIAKLLSSNAAVASAAESELTAIYLLRAGNPHCEVEIGREVLVGDRMRRPDCRARHESDRWTYIEVTQLNKSMASARAEGLLSRISSRVISILHPFSLTSCCCGNRPSTRKNNSFNWPVKHARRPKVAR